MQEGGNFSAAAPVMQTINKRAPWIAVAMDRTAKLRYRHNWLQFCINLHYLKRLLNASTLLLRTEDDNWRSGECVW